MPGGGRDPQAVSMSVSMKEAKGTPSAPRPDAGERHAGTLLARAEPMLRRLRAEREALTRKLKDLASRTAKSHDAATTAVKLWARLEAMYEAIRILALPAVALAEAGAGGAGGGGTSGGEVRNTGPPTPNTTTPGLAHSVWFGTFMASFLGCITGLHCCGLFD